MISESFERLRHVEAPANPFPGLRPFELRENHLFFGRDGQTEKLIAKLAPARFVAVVGTSGSGKSSLARAGLMPALLGGMMVKAGASWRIAVLRPGNEPIANLARCLNTTNVFGSEDAENAALQIAITESILRRGSLGLVEAVRQANLPSTENLLIVVDQFEELSRFALERKSDDFANEAAAFVKLLLEAHAQRELNIYVALTMRSDFLGDCAQFPDLPEAINESQFLVPRLTRDQLREAITGPVFVAGGEISQPLVNRLLNDIGDDQDQLPILQHALMRTWNEWRAKHHQHQFDQGPHDPRPVDRMNLCCYEAVGGWREALSRHADEALAELMPRQRQIAQKMFKLLTEKDRDNRAIRRLTRLGEICAVAGATLAEVEATIEVFRKEGRSFLMMPAAKGLTENALIDISHESLIRNWQRLNEWAEEETASANEYRRLADTAERHKLGRESFLIGNGLQTALDWQKRQAPTPAWAQRCYGVFDEQVGRHYGEFSVVTRFLEQSRQSHEDELARLEREREEKIERDKRELRRARTFVVILAAAFLLALLSAVYAWRQRTTALKLKDEAELQKQEAQDQRQIAVKKTNEAEESARKANLQADVARAAEEQAQKQSQIAKQEKQKAERFSFEKAMEAANAVKEKGRANSLYYTASLSLAHNAFQSDNRPYGYELLDAFLEKPDADLREFYWYHLWYENHQEKVTLKGHEKIVNAVAFSPDGRTLASGSSDNMVRLWDVASQQEKVTLKGHDGWVMSVVFSSDGRTLASGTRGDMVKLWDVARWQERGTIKGDFSLNGAEAFSPDGRILARCNLREVRLYFAATDADVARQRNR